MLDNIERLLEYVPIGPRFSNQVLQTLLVLIKRIPPNSERKLMILATTSSLSILKDMEFKQTFNVITRVPALTKPEHVVKGKPPQASRSLPSLFAPAPSIWFCLVSPQVSGSCVV